MCLFISISVQSFSRVRLFALQPHEPQHSRLPCPSPTPRAYSNSCPLSQWMPSNHLILCHPLLLPPSIILSIRVFSNESVLHIRWPNYWSFRISPSNVYSALISFRTDWFDLFALQGTLSRVFSNTTVQASILRCSAFFIVSTLTSIHDYWKNHSFD